MKRKKIWQKISAVVLSQVFVLSTLFVAPVSAVAKPVSEIPVISPDNISVSSYNGSVYKTYTAPGMDRLVVLIQDAHCNPGVQHNICSMLEGLHNNYNIQLIGIEGAKGWINTAILNAIPNEEVRKEITRGMVNESIIDGATEFAGNQEDINAALYGVESKELYLNNLRAYKEVAETKKDALAQVELIKGALSSLQDSVLNETLSKLITAKSDFNSNDISYNEYISTLTDITSSNSISLEKYPNIAIMERSFSLEKDIDFDLVDKERTELIDLLSEKQGKEKLEELVTKSLQFRTGKMEGTDYYTYLCGLIPKDKDYPNLVKYADYVKATAKLNKKDLPNEKIELENELTNFLAKTPEEKTFVDLTQSIYLAEKLFNIKFTRNEFNSYKDTSEQPFLAFIKEQASKYNVDFSWDRVNANAWEECKKASLAFYQEALKREDVFVENLIKQMDTDNLSISALVTGGFHTEKIEEILASKGVSYVVVRPNVTEKAAEGVYNNIMNGLADSMLGHTMAPWAGMDEEVRRSAVIADLLKKGLATDTAAAEAKLKTLSKALTNYGTLEEVLAELTKDKADFQASLYAKVPDEAFGEKARAIYARLLSAVKEKYGQDIVELPGDIGIAHWNIRNEQIEVSVEALKLFSALVAKGIFDEDGMIKFLNEVVMAHEQWHKDNSSNISLQGEIDNLTIEAGNLRKLSVSLLRDLLNLFSGQYIHKESGRVYTEDILYADFIQGVLEDKYGKQLATTLATGRFQTAALAEIKGLKAEGTLFLDAELGDADRVDLATDKRTSRARLTDAQMTFIQSKGFASVVAQESVALGDVFSALTAIREAEAGSVTKKLDNTLTTFVTQNPGEKEGRLIVTKNTNPLTKSVKESLVAANLVLSKELAGIFAKNKTPQVQQYELALIPKDETAERDAFVAMLKAIKGIQGANVHFQFLGDNGEVTIEPGEDLKSLQTEGKDVPADSIYMVVLDPQGKDESKWKKDGRKYLPVRAMYDAVPVLASAIAGNDELSENGNLGSLEPFIRQLFELFYTVGDVKLEPAIIKDILTNPWSNLVIQILSQMPITTADWKAIDLMRRMIAIQA